jgi:hypothetical protein
LFACEAGREGLESNGLAVFAPDTPKATTPYHVSPVSVVVTEIVSELSGPGAIVYHSLTNWFPPIPITALEVKVSPAVSFTENVEAAEVGKQSQPTMITSGPFAVVSLTEQEVTYPHPVEADLSSARLELVLVLVLMLVVELVDVVVDEEVLLLLVVGLVELDETVEVVDVVLVEVPP